MAAREPDIAPLGSDSTVQLSRRKKLVFAVCSVVGLLVLSEFVLAVFGVMPAIVTIDPYVGFQSRIPLFERRPAGTSEGAYQTAANKLGLFNEQRFPAQKGPDTFRVFCLGGSTTYGRPYADSTSFVGWLRRYLIAADPKTDWQVINCGGISYASYRVAALMEELAGYEPDLFIVYSGHNEFLESRTYDGILDENPTVTRMRLLLYGSRLFSLTRSVAQRWHDGSRAAAAPGTRLAGEVTARLDTTAGLDLYHRDDTLRDGILRHYRFNLNRMVGLARAAGADVLFVQPAANLKDFSPFKSEHREGLTEPERREWERWFDEGVEAARTEDHSQALDAFENAMRIDDRHARLHYERGRSLMGLTRYDEARDAFRRACDEDVCPLRILSSMNAIVAQVARERDVDVVDFAAGLEDQSRREYGHAVLGSEYFLDHVHPTIEVHRLLGGLLFNGLIERGAARPDPEWGDARADAVVAAFERTLEPRDHALAQRNLAKVLRWAGKVEEADRLVAMATHVLTDDAETVALVAARLEREGKLEEARAQYERAVRLDPEHHEARNNIGTILVKQGQVDAAMAQFQETLKRQPDYDVAHHNLGLALSQLGRFDEAIEHFRHTLRINPGHADARASLGDVLIHQGKLAEALTHYNEALRINPRSARAHVHAGVVLRRLNRPDEAIEHYRRAVALDPDAAEAHYNLGLILCRRSEFDEALRCFERAVQVRPAYPEANYNLALALAQQGKIGLATQQFEQLLRIAPGHRHGCYNLGMLYARRGQFADALRVFRQGIRSAPDDAPLAGRLAWLLATARQAELRNGAEASRLAERACRQTGSKNPVWLDVLAAARAEAGRYAEAAQVARRASELAAAAGDAELAAQISERRELYLQHRPYRLE